jgi:hypothetical protein
MMFWRENDMKKIIPPLLALLTLIFSSLACEAAGTPTAEPVSLENLRLAYDEFGLQETSTFSVSDVIYAVAELKNAPQGAVVEAVWTAVDVTDTDTDSEIQEQTLDIEEESFSGTIYFRLSNVDYWPSGLYRVDIYLNGEPAQSLEFNVE